MGDMDPHVFSLNILVPETADFTDTQTGRIHDSDHCLLLDVGNSGDEGLYFLLRRDKRKIGIKLSERDLCRIPGLVKHVDRKKADL